MSDLREAAQQALNYWESASFGDAVMVDKMDALRAALAQQAEPRNQCGETCERAKLCATCAQALAQQAEGGGNLPPPLQAEPVEPVAWSGYDLDGMVEAFSRVIEAHHSSKHPFHNPIDMDAKMALRILRGFIPAMKAYAAPPQRKPLTEEEIDRIDACIDKFILLKEGKRLFARAVERAHGIKE